jgi:hypothetical protein
MRRHLQYARYLFLHKWFVYAAGMHIEASPFLCLIHDLSKFRLSEWIPYARCFYAPDGTKQYQEDINFNQAWNAHQKRNKHHWQYWLLFADRGDLVVLPMPVKYVYEMVADWMGAGRAITGRWKTDGNDGEWEVQAWYETNKQNMQLHSYTRSLVEAILNKL